MKTISRELTTDKINSKSENEMILNWRFIFPGNAKISISPGKLSLRLYKRQCTVGGRVSDELSLYIRRNRPDCVLVSGGIDSSLLAAIAKRDLGSVRLVSAGTPGSEDLSFSNELAREIGERLYVSEINEENAIDAIKHLEAMHLDTYDIIMGITEFIAVKKAAELGCKSIMSGLGSDELFFGFYKHSRMSATELAEYREEKLFYMPAFDLLRINSIAASLGVNILLPYLSDGVMSMAMSQVKTEYNDKAMLRSAAREIGLSMALTERKKKAMQYGSGVVRLLRDLSRKKHEKVGELIKGI